MNPYRIHTDGDAVPNVDGTDLGNTLADLAGVHEGIDLIRDGIRLIAHHRHDLRTTQLLLATLNGSPDATDLLGAIGQLIARLTNPDTNPCLRHLDFDAQNTAYKAGSKADYDLRDPELRDTTSAACAALDQPTRKD